MKQSRIDSAIEAAINIAIGFLLSWAFWQWVVDPLFGFHTAAREGFFITALYTILSFFRQFLIRRWLNGKIIWEEWLHRRRKPRNPFANNAFYEHIVKRKEGE